MDFEGGGPVLKPVLLIGGQSTLMGIPKHLLPFPDGRLAFEHALETLHSAIPSASIIYISIHDESQKQGIQFRLDDPELGRIIQPSHDDHPPKFPQLEVLIDEPGQEHADHAAGLLTALKAFPDSKWLVFACGYPLLPPPALQQLILEYKPPITCFVSGDGLAAPLVGIWDPEAILRLRKNDVNEKIELDTVVRELGGKLIRPLREDWIKCTNTKEGWEEAMAALF